MDIHHTVATGPLNSLRLNEARGATRPGSTCSGLRGQLQHGGLQGGGVQSGGVHLSAYSVCATLLGLALHSLNWRPAV